jgi:ferrous iron transport protein B
VRDPSNSHVRTRTVAIVGNPNCGKTTVFNALTGLRQRVGNYPGVTVERKEGKLSLPGGELVTLIDLPGTYSLHATSPDERVASEIILGARDDLTSPDLVVCVVDASSLERGLYLVGQLIDQEIPLVLALNMADLAARNGISIDIAALRRELRIPIVPLIANRGTGLDELRKAIASTDSPTALPRQLPLPEVVAREWDELAGLLGEVHGFPPRRAYHEAIALLTLPEGTVVHREEWSPEVLKHLARDHARLDFLGFRRETLEVEARHAWSQALLSRVITRRPSGRGSASDRIDAVVTHRIWGFFIFVILMGLLFQAIFSWAEIPMHLIGTAFGWLGKVITGFLPPGDLRDLVVDGALAGVAAVVMFLPQILFLFLFLGLLEETGYMARAAYIMDRVMGKFGLHGKSFIPLLSSFACAIPGIMATRTIDDSRDRLATMLVAPLMSCSARLPVYALLIAATIPAVSVLGIISLPALTLLLMYFLGLVAAIAMAWLFRRTFLRGSAPVFIMEMPPYRLPSLRSILLQMWERAVAFLRRAGTIILGASILLWFLASYPKSDGGTRAERLEHSFAGQAGRLIEPLIAPLGFDWKIGLGLVSSLFQREMFVSTMATIYNVQGESGGGSEVALTTRMQQDTNPTTGLRLFTPLTGISLMIYYVLAMQCLSTVAVMRRETGGWKWPLFQIAYMSALAYATTFAVYRCGLWLGAGG